MVFYFLNGYASIVRPFLRRIPTAPINDRRPSDWLHCLPPVIFVHHQAFGAAHEIGFWVVGTELKKTVFFSPRSDLYPEATTLFLFNCSIPIFPPIHFDEMMRMTTVPVQDPLHNRRVALPSAWVKLSKDNTLMFFGNSNPGVANKHTKYCPLSDCLIREGSRETVAFFRELDGVIDSDYSITCRNRAGSPLKLWGTSEGIGEVNC